MTPVSLTLEISAVLPAYNEEANLDEVVRRTAEALASCVRTSEIIVVDDGSQDGSAAVLDRLKASYPTLRVVRHPHNRGYGAAVRSGFRAARYPWVFMMDADNQFDPSDIEALVCHTAEADIVTGLLAPAGTPKEIIDLLHRTIAMSIAPPEFRERLLALGFDPVASTPEHFAQWISEEIAKWGKVIREANIGVQ